MFLGLLKYGPRCLASLGDRRGQLDWGKKTQPHRAQQPRDRLAFPRVLRTRCLLRECPCCSGWDGVFVIFSEKTSVALRGEWFNDKDKRVWRTKPGRVDITGLE